MIHKPGGADESAGIPRVPDVMTWRQGLYSRFKYLRGTPELSQDSLGVLFGGFWFMCNELHNV